MKEVSTPMLASSFYLIIIGDSAAFVIVMLHYSFHHGSPRNWTITFTWFWVSGLSITDTKGFKGTPYTPHGTQRDTAPRAVSSASPSLCSEGDIARYHHRLTRHCKLCRQILSQEYRAVPPPRCVSALPIRGGKRSTLINYVASTCSR